MREVLVHECSDRAKPLVIEIPSDNRKGAFLYLFQYFEERDGPYNYQDTISKEAIDELESEIEKKRKLKRKVENGDHNLEEWDDYFSPPSSREIQRQIDDFEERLKEIKELNDLYVEAKKGDGKAAYLLLEKRKKNNMDEYWFKHKMVEPQGDEVPEDGEFEFDKSKQDLLNM